ncbi:MAG: ABC transporter ATP-binding protein [Paracoccaceae bacterium]|jgi:ATP-binding cassette subfamily B multidrug efflux pump|nr:ABC transporter ATP-binding protein [Paracoccaceae bacterium]
MFRFFENLIDPFQNFAQETPPARLWAYVKSHYAPYYRLMIWMGVVGALVAFIETGLIFYSGRVIDLMEITGPESFWSRNGLELLLAALFILLLRPAIIGFSHLLMEQGLVSNLHDQVRFRAHKHMLGQSANFFQNDFAGRLSNRVMQMGQAVEDATYMVFEALWFSIAYILGAMLILGQTDWRLMIPLAIWVVLYVAYTVNVAIRVSVASEKWSDARSLLTGRIVDAYSNIETVKLFSAGEREESYVLNALRRHRLRFQRFLRLMTEMSFIQNILNGFLIVGMLGPAVWLWTKGIVTAGEVAAASALTIRLNGMSGWIMWVTIRLFEHAGVIKEGLRSIAVPHEVTDAEGATELGFDTGRIEFANVSHHYGKGRGGLDGVNLTIEPGQKVGLVGRSGAGKSSLVNLLLRFRDAEQGQILIDGQDVAQVTQDSLRSHIGMVSQDNSLLHRSVRANILFGKPGATEAQMIAAARRAEAHDFIQDLSDPKGRSGYNAHVGERGVKLSGGQRQRIALARVVLKDAPILVLDEATSALDSEVEAAILETLYGVMEGKTVIAIAHRLSTIAQMDRIVVMDQGRVVEDGTHDALLARGGIYAELWSMQSGGFLG